MQISRKKIKQRNYMRMFEYMRTYLNIYKYICTQFVYIYTIFFYFKIKNAYFHVYAYIHILCAFFIVLKILKDN